MTLTAYQVRVACALLRWSSPALAERSGVDYRLVCMAWSRDTVMGLSDADRDAVCGILEAAGVRFMLDSTGQHGAELQARA